MLMLTDSYRDIGIRLGFFFRTGFVKKRTVTHVNNVKLGILGNMSYLIIGHT